MRKSLILCCTPLQMLIAEQIIIKNKCEEFYFVLITDMNNDKLKYYYKKIRKRVSKAEYILVPTAAKIPSFLLRLKLKSIKMSALFNRVYISSIDNIIFHILIHHIIHQPAVEIKTFDDGTANVNSGSSYFMKNNLSLKGKLLNQFFCKGTDIEFLRKNSLCHYTIYKNLPNIVDNLIPIELFKFSSDAVILEEKNILIGQPLYKSNDKKSQNNYLRMIHQALKLFDIEYYYPHPRETFELKNISYIHSPLIIEDYVVQELKINPGLKINIFTYVSTVALNLYAVPRVKIIALKGDMFRDSNIYDLYEKMGIQIVDLVESELENC